MPKTHRRLTFRLSPMVVALVGAAPMMRAQCTNPWLLGTGGLGGANNWVAAFGRLQSGDVVAAGQFNNIAGVARWTGSAWTLLGSGMTGSLTPGRPPAVRALTTLPNGDLVAGGDFTTAGGVSASGIARWDGTSWSPLGAGVCCSAQLYGFPAVDALAVLPNGDLVAGGVFVNAGSPSSPGSFGLARWNGSSWSPMWTAASGALSSVRALAVMPNGDLVAAAAAILATSDTIVRWNGTTWTQLGTGLTGRVFSLLALPNGDLVAAGNLSVGPASNIARWDGTNWSAVGSAATGDVLSLGLLPNGDLLAGGVSFNLPGGVDQIARWDGTNWTALGSGVRPPWWSVRAFGTKLDGNLLVSGNLLGPGGTLPPGLDELTTSCAATAISSGSGCVGAGGPNLLTTASLPWIGSTFSTTATGLTANSLGLSVHGFSAASTPLATILPQGVPGCTLQVSPDLVDLSLPIGGTLQTALVIPDTLTLVGQTLLQQVLPIELDAQGNILAMTSTNALVLTIGSF